MSTKQVRKTALVATGVLMLFYLVYGYTHPEKHKGRAQRIGGVNASPRVSMSFTLSNTLAPNAASPIEK